VFRQYYVIRSRGVIRVELVGRKIIKCSGWKSVQERVHLKMWAQNENEILKRS